MEYTLTFDVKSKYYNGEVDLVEVDDLGYDIYIVEQDDPINLGDIAYFENIPNKEDVEKWLNDFQIIGE